MSLQFCSVCEQRQPGAYAQCNWAWWRADNVRVAYRQKVCLGCYAQWVAPLTQATVDGDISCPSCHTDSSADMDPCYLTAYVPGVGRLRYEMPTCSACAAVVRVNGMRGAVQLVDREPSSEGRGPQTQTPRSEWERFGVGPRE